jgi:hypothetical protein
MGLPPAPASRKTDLLGCAGETPDAGRQARKRGCCCFGTRRAAARLKPIDESNRCPAPQSRWQLATSNAGVLKAEPLTKAPAVA